MTKQMFMGLLLLIVVIPSFSQKSVKVTRKDRKKDIELLTTAGTIVLRLYDSTPLHRDNFLRLVKSHYYDGTLFHRVIQRFMIQGGDPESKKAEPGQTLGNGGPDYTIPAEFHLSLFHKKGALAAAREGDQVNPSKASSGSQFYIVQGKQFSEAGLDSLEKYRLHGRQIPPEQREVYKTIGGTPHLDQSYTVFGEVIEGLNIVDMIAAVPTSRQPPDRPIDDIRILQARLIKRKK